MGEESGARTWQRQRSGYVNRQTDTRARRAKKQGDRGREGQKVGREETSWEYGNTWREREKAEAKVHWGGEQSFYLLVEAGNGSSR